MENQKQNKLGAGIITISVIQIIFSAFALFGSIILLIPSFQENLVLKKGLIPKLIKQKILILLQK